MVQYESMIYSDVATKGVVEFLQDELNYNLVIRLRRIFLENPQMDRGLNVRSTVLCQFGAIPLEPGPKMGLMVRFIELGLALVDWDRVIKELDLDPRLGELNGSHGS